MKQTSKRGYEHHCAVTAHALELVEGDFSRCTRLDFLRGFRASDDHGERIGSAEIPPQSDLDIRPFSPYIQPITPHFSEYK